MTNVFGALSEAVIEQLGWTLVHFLWQGAAVAAIVWTLLWATRKHPPRSRYIVAVVGMIVMVLLPIVTFCFLAPSASDAARTPAALSTVAAIPSDANYPRSGESADRLPMQRAATPEGTAASNESSIVPSQRSTSLAEETSSSWRPASKRVLPWLVVTWAAGVCLIGLWHLGGWYVTFRLRRRGTGPVPANVAELFERLKDQWRLSRPVQLLQSAIVQTPVVIGWLRPVVLLPAGLITGLSIAQIEAILAHELAHIRRHDYLVNVLQTLAETALFYHPAVWWLSRQIRQEREHCCDDVAADLCGSNVTYAETLMRVAEMCRGIPAPAVAATGGVLLPRIARLLGVHARGDHGMRRSLVAVSLVLLAVGAPLILNLGRVASAQTNPAAPAVARTLSAPKGTLRDEAGQPLAGAKVILYHNAQRGGLDDRLVEAVTADAQGRFAFTQSLSFRDLDDYDGDIYALIALDPSHGVTGTMIRCSTKQDSFDLTALKAREQRVHVVDADGKPIAGARVGINSVYIPDAVGVFNLRGEAGLPTATTDAEGIAIVRNVPARGETTFRVEAAGYGARDSSNRAAPTVEVVMTHPAVVTGTVMAQGRPLPNAIVAFSAAKDLSYTVQVRTDASGKFRAELIGEGGIAYLDARVPGDFRVELTHPDFAAASQIIHLTPGQSMDLPIDAEPGVILSGKLLEGGTNKPIAGARMLAWMPSSQLHAYTNADGRFSWRVAGKGEASIYFDRPPEGFFLSGDPSDEPTVSQTIAFDGSEKQIEFTLKTPSPLTAQTTLTGHVMLADGTPGVGVKVEVAPKVGEPRFYSEARAKADGSFTLPQVPAGSMVTLYAETADRTSAETLEVAIPRGGGAPTPVKFALRPTETVEVQVVDASGKPLVDTSLDVAPSFDHYSVDFVHQVRTDATGRAKIGGVIAGNQYEVHVSHPPRGAPEDANAFVVLLPKEGPATKEIVLSTLLPVRVVDAAGVVVVIADIQSLEVELKPRETWTLGPKPAIQERLVDGWVLIDRQQVVLAHDKNEVRLTFKSADGAVARAHAPFPVNTSRMELTLLDKIQNAAVAAGGAGLPNDIAADELVGRVVDAAGKAVAGAKVSFPDNRPNQPDRIAAITTNDAGIFRVPHIPRFLYAQIDAAGYARRWLTTLETGKGFTITLDNTTHLRGTVLTIDGKPAAGTQVTLETSRPRPDSPDRDIPNLQLTVQTDAEGKFDTLIEPGEYELFATGPAGTFARIPKQQVKAGQASTQNVQLAPGVHLRVKAVDAVTGEPVAGAKFVIWKQLPFVIDIVPGSERTTDAKGIADWESVMPGQQAIDQMERKFARWSTDATFEKWQRDRLDNQPLYLDLKPGMPEVVVRIESALHITGKVVDPRGKGIPGVFVNVEGFQTGDRRYMRTTDDKGAFDLYVPGKFINGGMYQVVASRQRNYDKPDVAGESFAPKPGGEKEVTLTLPDASATAPATRP